MKPTSTPTPTRPRSRYGTLRPCAAQILEWCAQGDDDWPLIRARLAELGVTVRMGTLWGYALTASTTTTCLPTDSHRGDSRLRTSANTQNNTHPDTYET